ncbi:hypothetical protein [Frankia sp. Cj3]|uniref:hypothetical protein n=1 Tax=Frankia sp. Cj3 TaxID=2880976 RepID=UPI001EF4EA82|nr:hypothetical protein [Frankia sp. Cj3]
MTSPLAGFNPKAIRVVADLLDPDDDGPGFIGDDDAPGIIIVLTSLLTGSMGGTARFMGKDPSDGLRELVAKLRAAAAAAPAPAAPSVTRTDMPGSAVSSQGSTLEIPEITVMHTPMGVFGMLTQMAQAGFGLLDHLDGEPVGSYISVFGNFFSGLATVAMAHDAECGNGEGA